MFLYLYLADSCNLRCRHCWISSADTDSPLQTLSRRIAEMAIGSAVPLGLKEVKLTGGEPTLAPDFEGIVSAIGERGIRVSIETNATVLSDSTVKVLAEHRANVSVSLDSFDQALHNWLRGRSWAFERAVAGIRRLVAAEVSVNAIMSVCDLNLSHIEGTLSLCRELGIRSLKLNPMIPLGRASAGEFRPHLLESDGIQTLLSNVDHLSAAGRVRIMAEVPCALQSLENCIKGTGNCHFLNILSVLPNGDISFCGLGASESPWIIGNIDRDRIPDIWDSSVVIKRLREGLPSRLMGICSKCLFRNRCRGGCRALAFADGKDFFGPHPICAMFHRQGKFPASRVI